MILNEKKATPEFFKGDTGGGGWKCSEESDCKNSEIFFKLIDTTEGYQMLHRRLYGIQNRVSEMVNYNVNFGVNSMNLYI